MQIYLNVNDLVEQLVSLTEKQNKAFQELESLKSELQSVKTKLGDYEVDQLKRQIDKQREQANASAENVRSLGGGNWD